MDGLEDGWCLALLVYLAEQHPASAVLPASFGRQANRKIMSSLSDLRRRGLIDYAIRVHRFGADPLPVSLEITTRGLRLVEAGRSQD